MAEHLSHSHDAHLHAPAHVPTAEERAVIAESVAPAPTSQPAPGVSARGLAIATAKGFAWTTASTVAGKLVSTFGQLALAWILAPSDMGAVGLATAIASFPAILQTGGIATVLMSRQRKYHLYANACAWMSAALGLGAAVVLVGIGPIAGHIMRSSSLPGLLAISAVVAIISGLGVVPTTTLQIQMRFRLMAIISVVTTVLLVGVSVPLAYFFHWGAYSVLVGTAVSQAASLAISWHQSRPPICRRAQIRRWKYIFHDGWKVLGTNLIWNATGQGDRLILGARLGDVIVGNYFFAFNLSYQAVQLLTANLAAVFLPMFSKLSDQPALQVRMFLRAGRLLALLGVPLALLQAAGADSGLRILFHDKWLAAIPLMQWFSIGMAAYVVSGTVNSLFVGQGRFRTVLWMAISYLFVFMTTFTLAVYFGGVAWAAATVGVLQWIYSFLGIYLGIRPGGGTLMDIVKIYAFPVLASVAALAPGLLLGRFAPAGAHEQWFRAGFILASVGIIYPLLVVLFERDASRDLLELIGRSPIGRLLGRHSRGRAATS